MAQTDCIEWEGAFNPQTGYPQVGGVTVHRMALAIRLRRAVKQGHLACHTCDNRKCINPDHLYEGTPSQNQRDRAERNPGSWEHVTGERNFKARLTDEQVAEIRARRTEGEAIKDLASEYGYDPSSVWRMTDGKQRRLPA